MTDAFMPAELPVAGRRRALASALRRNPLLLTGALIAAVLVVIAIFAPWLAPHPGDAGSTTNPVESLLGPSSAHWMGTDALGRDIFSRVLYGARISLSVAGVVLVLSIAIGLPLGLAAGFFGGWVDAVIMRVTDVFLAFPALLLSLALAAVLTPSVKNATIAIAATWWPWYARLARGQAASIAGRPFIEASRALGLSPFRTLFRHVLPNALTPVLVQASLDVGGIILTAAALSFLGLGAQDPTPEWGLMVSQGQSYFTTQWWLVTFPGAGILVAALAFNLVGDGLREVLDPRRIQRR